MHTDRLKMIAQGGQARPVHPGDLLPEALDNALGATEAREAWVVANDEGKAANRALVEGRREFMASTSQRDYIDDNAHIAARDMACRPLEDAIDALTPKAKAALLRYDEAQRLGFAAARGTFAEHWLDADRRALDALQALDAAVAEREALQRYVTPPDRSDSPGRGHWSRSITLREKGLAAEPQRRDIAIVVRSAPRDLVRAMPGAAK